jgi:uncharacterized peroxidase-related enzyme
MRLQILKNGHNFLQKVQFRLIKTMMGQLPGPIAVLSYRRAFFGKHYTRWLQNTMRKMEHWTLGEVELMGAYVSKNNECQYCLIDHVAVANNVYDADTIQAILDNLDTAPIDNKTKLILAFIKKLTVSPSELTKADITPLLTEGLSKKAIEEAIHVCGTFNVMNRLADAFDFAFSSDPKKTGKFLYKNGYAFASVRG